jgi:DNA-binding NtrC family response regulator
MSGMDGTELYRDATAAQPELTGKALMMTGDTLNPQLLEFASENNLRLIAKPFDIDDLVAEVDSALTPA